MPIDIKVLHGGVGILYLCHGTVTGKDFIEANKRILSFNEQLHRAKYGIVDETAIDGIHMSESEMLTIAAQDKKMAGLVPPGAIVAVIAKGDLAVGLARIWESFIEHTGWETMIFGTRWKAESWIKEKVKANNGIDLIFEESAQQM
jgi:hypothetical protein